jgi:hypothetical protein
MHFRMLPLLSVEQLSCRMTMYSQPQTPLTECFVENLLPNGVLLPNSAHMSVSSLYQFLVLTAPPRFGEERRPCVGDRVSALRSPTVDPATDGLVETRIAPCRIRRGLSHDAWRTHPPLAPRWGQGLCSPIRVTLVPRVPLAKDVPRALRLRSSMGRVGLVPHVLLGHLIRRGRSLAGAMLRRCRRCTTCLNSSGHESQSAAGLYPPCYCSTCLVRREVGKDLDRGKLWPWD